MKTKIVINSVEVEVSPETFRRLEKLAAEKSLQLDQAVSFLFEKVI
jgi:hypothetical protein